MLEEASMRDLVLAAAGVRGNHKLVIREASRRAGLSYRTVKSAYYGEIRSPQHKAVAKLSEAAKRNIPNDLATVLATQAERMERTDPEMYRGLVADIRALECTLRNLGAGR